MHTHMHTRMHACMHTRMHAHTHTHTELPAVVNTAAVGVARGEGVASPADAGYAGARKQKVQHFTQNKHTTKNTHVN